MTSLKKQMHKIVLYPGTFDPITNGHINVIERSAKLFDEVIVSVATNLSKTPLFSAEERVEMIKKDVSHLKNIKVESFGGLLVDFAKKKEACAIVRGLRPISDFEYEFQLATTNMSLCSEMETILLPAVKDNHFISSSMVKEVARLGGDVSDFVSPVVKKILAEKFRTL